MNAYREAAEMPAPEPDLVPCGPERAAGGYLLRDVPCKTPGMFMQWWHNIRYGDVWTCRCGTSWRRSHYQYVHQWERISTPKRSTER